MDHHGEADVALSIRGLTKRYFDPLLSTGFGGAPPWLEGGGAAREVPTARAVRPPLAPVRALP